MVYYILFSVLECIITLLIATPALIITLFTIQVTMIEDIIAKKILEHIFFNLAEELDTTWILSQDVFAEILIGLDIIVNVILVKT